MNVGNILMILWLGYVYMIEDTLIYTWHKSRNNIEKLENILKREHIIYKDESYPIWRRALSKSRLIVLEKRIPNRANITVQKKLTDFVKNIEGEKA